MDEINRGQMGHMGLHLAGAVADQLVRLSKYNADPHASSPSNLGTHPCPVTVNTANIDFDACHIALRDTYFGAKYYPNTH